MPLRPQHKLEPTGHLIECRSRFPPGRRLGICISNELPGEAEAAGLRAWSSKGLDWTSFSKQPPNHNGIEMKRQEREEAPPDT